MATAGRTAVTAPTSATEAARRPSPTPDETMATPCFDRARRFGRPAGSGQALGYFLGGLAGLCALAAVLVLGMLVDLLVHRGAIDIPAGPEAAAAEALAGQPPQTVETYAHFVNTGILPQVWRSRGLWYGAFLKGLYQRVGPLHRNVPALATLVAAGVALSLLAAIIVVLHQRLVQTDAQDAARRLRAALRMQVFRLGAFDLPAPREPGPAELFNERVELVRAALVERWLVESRAALWTPPFIIAALMTQFWVAIAAILLLIVVWRGLRTFERRYWQPKAAMWHDRVERETTSLLDSLRQVRMVRGLGLADTPGEPFERGLNRLHAAALSRDRVEMIAAPLLLAAMVLTGWGVVALAAANVLREPPRMTVAGCVTMTVSLLCAAWPLARARRARSSARRAEPSARAIFDYLDREPVVAQRPDARELRRLGKSLRFEAITLTDRAQRPVVNECSFEIAAGKRLAILATDPQVGLALACLAPRFHDPASGAVLFDGQDVRAATLESLQAQIGLVLQEGLLFTGSVHDNIVCGDSRFSLVQATEAARQAQAYNFVQQLPQGFSTVIGEFGESIPPWDAFRIGLARAVLREPALLILEEPRSPLDAATSEMMDHTLAHVGQRCTTLILPSRMASLRDADLIVLVDGGKVVDQGTHAELLHRSALYRHVLYQRFSGNNGAA